MKVKFKKVKTEHTIMSEFHKILLEIEKINGINRIIPGRISRQQKGSSELNFKITIPTPSGWKCIMSKGGTAQELFVICEEGQEKQVELEMNEILKKTGIDTKSRIKID